MTHSELCGAILVTGDTSTSGSEGGLYVLSNESASAAPNNPVWKNSDGSRFIFNSGSVEGWRIGEESDLTSGNSYSKGRHILMIFPITCTGTPGAFKSWSFDILICQATLIDQYQGINLLLTNFKTKLALLSFHRFHLP